MKKFKHWNELWLTEDDYEWRGYRSDLYMKMIVSVYQGWEIFEDNGDTITLICPPDHFSRNWDHIMETTKSR